MREAYERRSWCWLPEGIGWGEGGEQQDTVQLGADFVAIRAVDDLVILHSAGGVNVGLDDHRFFYVQVNVSGGGHGRLWRLQPRRPVNRGKHITGCGGRQIEKSNQGAEKNHGSKDAGGSREHQGIEGI